MNRELLSFGCELASFWLLRRAPFAPAITVGFTAYEMIHHFSMMNQQAYQDDKNFYYMGELCLRVEIFRVWMYNAMENDEF